MPTLRAIVDRLFTRPGGPPAESRLLPRAARAHQHLFQRECQNNARLFAAVPLLRKRSQCRADHGTRDRLLCHPVFVEGLHRLSLSCPHTQAWHAAVATPSMVDTVAGLCRDGRCLGTIEFALRVLEHCTWEGRLLLTSDLLGRVPFPLSDWSLTLRSADPASDRVLAQEPIEVVADRRLVRWQWTGEQTPFLAMTPERCRRIVADNPECMDAAGIESGSERIAPEFGRALPLCEDGVRYERVHIANSRHAANAAGIVRTLHESISRNSPGMHRELCTYGSSIRGFELHLETPGIVQSFSDPTLPGVMNFNVPHDDRDEPRVSSLCFTCLAHELAHTKFYLINDIAYDHGWVFVRNGAEMTDEIERYARRLPLRTLFQIPYTHLYEWESLMDFLEVDFTGLSWPIDEDPIAFGADLKAEIAEALALTDEMADMTRLGTEAFARFQELYSESLSRWDAFAAA
ncbi:MAG: hypothetical protein AB7U20_02975 [Planctomycetaceae bacterium]